MTPTHTASITAIDYMDDFLLGGAPLDDLPQPTDVSKYKCRLLRPWGLEALQL